MKAGGGYKKFYSSLDAFFLRTVTYTTFRIWGFGLFYDWINPDARRIAKPDFYGYAAVAGGLTAGVLTNPVEIVFRRMQVDEMYPQRARRNYRSFIEGLSKVSEEGALFRGAVPNGLRIAALFSGVCAYDYMKENVYYFFGPISMVRLVATVAGCAVAQLASMPFDLITTRMHTMRPLPNGEMPYKHSLDCFAKIWYYEGNLQKMSNMYTFYNGGQAYFGRLLFISLATQYMLDWYLHTNRQSEFWQPARYFTHTGIDYDIHNPYTDAYNQQMLHPFKQGVNLPAFHPHNVLGQDSTFFIV